MFESARSKVNRAQRHLHEFKAAFQSFIAEKPHRFGVKHDRETGQAFVQIRFVVPIPPAFCVIIGDCVHNLRCALDHLMWELIGIDNGKQHKHLYFVTRDNESQFRGDCKAIDTPSDWVRDLLITYEAFPGGKGAIFHLINSLDTADKHRVITPVLRASGHPPFVIFNADGSVHKTMIENLFVGGASDYLAIAPIPIGGHLELQDDADCPPDIFLPDVQGENVATVLNNCGHSVASAINEAEAFVSKNKP